MNKLFFFSVLFGIVSFLFLGCQRPVKLTSGEGYIRVTGGKVWYRIVGEGTETPLVLLHGGPGMPSYYLNPMTALSKERPVIFFDQLGCGRSDDNRDTTLMTVSTFVEQLEQLTDSLGIKKFHIYGHSWGSMLGMDYYLQNPDRVTSIIFASPCLSVSKWEADCRELIRMLPDSTQLALMVNESEGNFNSPEYQNAVTVFYRNFLARKLPWDKNLDSTFARANFDIYNYMWGPSEFSPTGTLKNYDRTMRLGEIKVPTLYVCGEHDEARPSTVRDYQRSTPDAEFAVIRDAAHLSMHDNPAENNRIINEFLNEIKDQY